MKISWFKVLQTSLRDMVVGKYVRVQILSVLDTLMTTTYWLVIILILVANASPKSITALVFSVSVASLLRPLVEPPSNHGLKFLLRTYMELGRRGAVRFGKLYWSLTIINALLASMVGAVLLISWIMIHADTLLWISMLIFSSIASLPAQLPALLLDDSVYFRVVLLSNFTRYVVLYAVWRGTADPQRCFESFLMGSALALLIGIGYATWKGVRPKAWDINEVKMAMRMGMPAWLEGFSATIARWGALTLITCSVLCGALNPLSTYYVFAALLTGGIIAALLSGWVNVVLLTRSRNQHTIPVRIVGTASGVAFPFATYFTLSALHSGINVDVALLAGALLASLPIDLLGSLFSSKAYAVMIPRSPGVLRKYGLAQLLTAIIAYGTYLGLMIAFRKLFIALVIMYLAIRVLSLIIIRLVTRGLVTSTRLQAVTAAVAVIIPLSMCACLALLLPSALSNLLCVITFSATLALLINVLISALHRACLKP